MSSSDVAAIEVVRNGFTESVHRARVVVTGPDGTVQHALGDVGAPMFPRSSNKPLQAVAMVRAGLDVEGELLALVAASHSGEAFHRDGVRRILGGCGLEVSELQNTVDHPSDEVERERWIREGHHREAIAMNCSGKHAGMLRTCRLNGWSRGDYLDPPHPLQRRCRETVAELAGEEVAADAVDGCGAPLHGISLAGLARAFGRIAAADAGPERTVADAIRQHPEWTSGTRREEAAIHRAVPGSVGKAGAEAVYAVGLADGRGLALKVVDGGPRGVPLLMAELLLALGHDDPALHRLRTAPVLGHGRPVGEVRVLPGLLADIG
ncbi:asparaginase [Desertihabitans aurantiacus]|uniref:asparaginase n=1 Tax=Desertihabitans aurantiacus TaxID=2282477 RepID=UPI000DF82037|nr:asparaginase [Desertihabitans aurantiacus]